MRDKTQYGNLLRQAYKQNFLKKDQWKPIYNMQKQSGHVFWSYEHNGMQWIQGKADIINLMIDLNDFDAYLEIGGRPWSGKSTYNKIKCQYKDSVDICEVNMNKLNLPEGINHYVMRSDDFFDQYGSSKKYDLIFIDGWHEHQQVKREIEYSLKCLNDGGLIILHDMVPPTRDLEADFTCAGTCWRAFADYRKNPNLKMDVLVPPWGTEDCLGFIQKGTQEIFDKEIEYTYEFFIENIESLMNLIDLDIFYKEYILPKSS